ncbi:MAG: YggU family protein [Deltaproteobacteria bacterium]|nr:YggU family protein [Deltaproteobacteria bacterium]
MDFVQENPTGFIIDIYVQPGASKNTIAGIHGKALKIKLTAPPVRGAANKMLIGFLAGCLGVSKSHLGILSGHRSRLKRVLVRYDQFDSKTERERLKEKIQKCLDRAKHYT